MFLAKLRDIHDYQDKKIKLSSSQRTEDPPTDKPVKEKGAGKAGDDAKPSSTS